jgi:exportin-2 (importin alpha re-exporter)
LFQSNDLNREILHVVGILGEPFIQMLGVRKSPRTFMPRTNR